MTLTLSDFAKRADELIAQADRVIASEWVRDYVRGTTSHVDYGLLSGCRAAALSFLRDTFGETHPYYRDLDARVKDNNGFSNATVCREILLAAKSEVVGGWSDGVRRLVSAELFSDFVEMAEHLLNEGYHGPAAVLLGSVLEEHLRELSRARALPVESERDGRPVPLKADTLNAALAAAGAYNKLDQKSITAWLDLRNKAAHGKFAEFAPSQVQLMYSAIVDILARLQSRPAI